MFVIRRLFQDNDHYGEKLGYDSNAYVEAISWLFEPNEFKNYEDEAYLLKDYISLPDFMSCVYHIIIAANSRHPKQTVNDIIFFLKSNRNNQIELDFYKNSNCIEHTKDTNGNEVIVFKNMHSTFIEDVLWAAYFYYLPNSQFNPDDKGSKIAVETLYNALFQESNLNETAFMNHLLIRKTNQAKKTYAMNFPKKEDNAKAKTYEPDNSEKLKAEIVSLTKILKDQQNLINKLQVSQREEDENAVIRRKDCNGHFVTKDITAKEAAEIVKKYNYSTTTISRKDMKEMLAELTGLKASSFQQYL